MRYAIIGTGALGGFYGGMLAKNGADVYFHLHSDYDHVVSHGLRVDSVLGDFVIPGADNKEGKKIKAYKTTKEMPQCDVVLVCLKTTNNNRLKELLPNILHNKSTVVLVQNGLGMESDLAKDLPGVAIAGAMAFICSTKKGPGHIEHADFGDLNIGGHVNTDIKVLEQICDDLKSAGVTAKLTEDLNDFRWRKLVWNIPYNGMTVIMNTGTDKLMKNPSMRGLIGDIMMEVIAAGNGCGAHIKEDFANKMLEYTDSMKPYNPSMKVDFDSGRAMEIDYIYTNPIKIAAEHGFKMSKTAVMESQLRFLTK